MNDDRKLSSKQKMTLAITGTMFVMVLALLVVIVLIDGKKQLDAENGALASGKDNVVSGEKQMSSDVSASSGSASAGDAAGDQTIDLDGSVITPGGSVSDGLTYEEKWQEGYVRYDGQVYKYNNNIRTFLFMGIDSDEKVHEAPDMVSGGQSDAMFLMAVDDASGSISVIALNRNTMTDIKVCDMNGRILGTYKAQLCLQHAYGDGLRLSCQRSVDAVSYLFYNIPIAGYLAMNMGGLPILNDAVGGVTVTLPEDFVIPATGTYIKAGEPFLLKGKDAYSFIRYRDTNEFDSASARLERHEIYLSALLKQMEKSTGGSKSKALDIYDMIEDYSVSSLIFSDIAEDISKYGFSDERMYSLSGETKQGSTFEEFIYDENELYRLILKIFYVIVI